MSSTDRTLRRDAGRDVLVIRLDGRQEKQTTLVRPGLWYGRFRDGRWRYYDRIGGAWGWLVYRERPAGAGTPS